MVNLDRDDLCVVTCILVDRPRLENADGMVAIDDDERRQLCWALAQRLKLHHVRSHGFCKQSTRYGFNILHSGFSILIH